MTRTGSEESLAASSGFEGAAARITAWPDGTTRGLVRPEFARQSSINNLPPSLPGGPWLTVTRPHARTSPSGIVAAPTGPSGSPD
jgi:hypothetical protein